MTVELTSDEYDSLMLILGYAAGSAQKEGNERWFRSCMRMANAVGKASPFYTPYAIDPEASTQETTSADR